MSISRTGAFGGGRRQALAEARLSQEIAVTPGHHYVLSAWANTTAVNATRGNTRVRLFATPTGSDHHGWQRSSQWYWTDGQWMRFQHQWTATAAHETIGLGLFRWWDEGWSGVCVDHVTVWDLGPAALAPGDAAADTQSRPSLVLADHRVEADDKVEARLSAPPGYVITGIGSRAQYDNITTMWLRIQPLLPSGKLGPPEQLRAGWELDAGLEAEVTLPDGYVATGFGAAVAPEWDVKRLRVWGRPLAASGTLGEEREFRGGIDRVSGVEKQVRLGPGRVLTAAGLNCMLNDINGILATSAVVRQTASSRLK